MSWEVDNQINVRVVTPSGTENEQFDGSMLLRDVVREVANRYSMKNLIVRTQDGRELEPEEGDRPVSEFGDLEITAKTVAA